MWHLDPILQNLGTTGLRKAVRWDLGFAIPSGCCWLRMEEPLSSPLPPAGLDFPSATKDEPEQDCAAGLPASAETGASETRVPF